MKGVDGELEAEPIFDDLLVHLISFAITNESQRDIDRKSLVLNIRIMLLFSVLCAARGVQPTLSSTRMKTRAV